MSAPQIVNSYTTGHVVQTVTTFPRRANSTAHLPDQSPDVPPKPNSHPVPPSIHEQPPIPPGKGPLASDVMLASPRESLSSSRRPESKGKSVNDTPSLKPSSRGQPINDPRITDPRITNLSTNELAMLSRNSSIASIRESDNGASRNGDNATVSSSTTPGGGMGNNNVTDFFSSEVFHIVLHNPTTAHRLLKFCQSRACGENMEFLQKVDQYNRLLDQASQLLGTIHSQFTATDAPRQINISDTVIKRVSAEIRQASQITIPALENIFVDPQQQIERLLADDVYPRFVKHQVTTSATLALANHRDKYQGLGDCFCLTDPNMADNPILFASDGFVNVTGYSRREIVPRNCRFLQGELTDTLAPKRLRSAIENFDETVELLLNYRKNGDPFWNLCYVSPLLNDRGEVPFFLGGQVNCSTTIHSCNDVLRILSLNDDELDRRDSLSVKSRSPPPSTRAPQRTKSSFFKSFRKYRATSKSSVPAPRIVVEDQAGMEGDLISKFSKLNFTTQVEAFYTAYSKYIVLEYDKNGATELTIRYYSPGIIDVLCLNLPNGAIAPIFHKDIFKVLAEHSSYAFNSSHSKEFRATVKDTIARGNAVSVQTGLMTGYAERRGTGSWFHAGNGAGDGRDGMLRRVEEKYVTHWTPLKDGEDKVKWVVMTIAPKEA